MNSGFSFVKVAFTHLIYAFKNITNVL